jgi:4-amino-4-deoxy-L-arabinose transferase-like glycosyltransferase
LCFRLNVFQTNALLPSEPLMPSLAVSERVSLPGARRIFAARLLRFLDRSHAHLCAVLVLLCLACYLPGFVSLQPMDRDEPRYAQASKQMLETGDFVDIRFQDEARHKKPVGIYWLQSASVALGEAVGLPEARITIALYRIPSLLGAIATVLLTYWAALAFLGRRGAFLAAAFMGASVILMVEARLAKTDAVLAACSVAVMGGLARAYFGRIAGTLSLRTVSVFWIGVAAGILVKGPVVLMFLGLAAAFLSVRERSARWLLALRPKLGILLTLVIVLPWFIAIAVKSGGAFYSESIGHDMLGKVGTAQTYHWAPPGFYLVAFFATFWPAAILAAIAVPFAWANRHDDLVAFVLAWVVPSWLVFEAVPTKLPHYVMPLYPAVAILTVMAIRQGFVGPHRPGAKLAALLIPFIPVGLTVGLCVSGWILDHTIPFTALPALIAASLLAVYAWRLFTQGQVSKTALVSLVASAPLAFGVFGLAQRDLRSLKLSPRLAEVARAQSCEDLQVATLGYREPSLVFLVGTGLDMLEGGKEAADFLHGGRCRLVFVERRFEEDFQASLAKLGLRPALSTRITGFNINGGRRLDIGAYVVSP